MEMNLSWKLEQDLRSDAVVGKDRVPAWLRFPGDFNEHLPAPQSGVAQHYRPKGILQGGGCNWRKTRQQRVLGKTFPSLAVFRCAPHPERCEAAHPKDPATGLWNPLQHVWKP